ncbi:MAG: TolC family protein [Planctomycetota bacterium]
MAGATPLQPGTLGVAWWGGLVGQPLRGDGRPVALDLPALMEATLRCSARVAAFESRRWAVAEETTIAEAAFDPTTYANTRFDDTSDPVGNALQTGGPPRLNEHIWNGEAGLRRRLTTGANVSLGQQLGHWNSNSLFFTPNNQGSSRLGMQLSQPLLRGRGRAYNLSFVVETSLAGERAAADYLLALQSQLAEVGAAYWSLTERRAVLLQVQRHVERAAAIADELEGRRGLDTVESQVLRARAAVATRRVELAQAAADIRNLEARIRTLTNADRLLGPAAVEIVPTQQPPPEAITPGDEASLRRHTAAALRRRPELIGLIADAEAAGIRVAQAEHELRPTLDLVAEAFVRGLDGGSDVGTSFLRQFNTGAPGYGLGVEFAAPIGNRAAKASLRQRRFEAARVAGLIREQVELVRAEVEVAARNLRVADQTRRGRRDSLLAVQKDLAYVTDRWRSLRGDTRLGRLQLEDLLAAQVRLLDEEKALAAAEAAVGAAAVELQRASGGLVQASPR